MVVLRKQAFAASVSLLLHVSKISGTKWKASNGNHDDVFKCCFYTNVQVYTQFIILPKITPFWYLLCKGRTRCSYAPVDIVLSALLLRASHRSTILVSMLQIFKAEPQRQGQRHRRELEPPSAWLHLLPLMKHRPLHCSLHYLYID